MKKRRIILTALLAALAIIACNNGSTEPETVDALDLSALVAAPVKDAAPDATAINETQYTGTIAWKENDGTTDAPAAFAAATIYKAIVTLTAKSGHTFDGVGADSFTHTGATSVANAANSGVVTITFPATAALISADAGLTSVLGESITAGTEDGSQGTPKTAAINVANGVGSVSPTDVAAASGATALLYSDSGFATAVTTSLALTPNVAVHLYVKVTAEDGATILHYDVAITRVVDAAAPNITSQPAPASYAQNAAATALSVTANATDGGTLSYEWFSNGTNSNSGGASVATTPTYTPTTATPGTVYYYVVVTNTNTAVSGAQTATAASNAVAITVTALVNAAAPNITGQPVGDSYVQDDPAAALSVTASATDGGTLSYQWFSNGTSSNSGGVSLGAGNGAQTASYTPPTATLGTVYYYVVVTNTITDNGDGGTKTAPATSNAVAITVTGPIDLTGKTSQNDIRDAITAGIASVTGSGTPLDPKVIPLENLDLSSGTNLENLFKGAAAAFTGSEYLSLDLTGCTGASVSGIATGTLDAATRDRFAAIILPNSVTSLTYANSSGAFQGFTNLKSITMPGVTSIGSYAFQECTSLTGITLPTGVTSIGQYAFRDSGLTSITIPNSVTSLGTGAFQQCTGLTSVTIGNSVTSLGSSVFALCTSLTSVTIPDSVTSLGSDAFYGCTGLTSITIPNSVTSLGQQAFRNCTNLATLTFTRATPPTVDANALQSTTALASGTVNVPNGTVAAYKAALTGKGVSGTTITDGSTTDTL